MPPKAKDKDKAKAKADTNANQQQTQTPKPKPPSIVPGPEAAKLEGRSLLFQLLLVQVVYDQLDEFVKVSDVLNAHPLLQFERKTSDSEAEELYHKLVAKYSIDSGGTARKKGVSRRTEALAETLYALYVPALAEVMESEKQEFAELYEQLAKGT